MEAVKSLIKKENENENLVLKEAMTIFFVRNNSVVGGLIET